jgi:hypothetical protein
MPDGISSANAIDGRSVGRSCHYVDLWYCSTRMGRMIFIPGAIMSANGTVYPIQSDGPTQRMPEGVILVDRTGVHIRRPI